MSSWNLRDQYIKAIDRWFLILGFIILGALLGFIISYILPTPFRAEADLYVGINITRVNEMEYLIPLAKEEPLNLDDYKNWQLKQLTDILYSDQVLNDVLSRLNEADQFWQDLSISDLRKNIDIYWYDTGIWRLRYHHREKQYALAVVQAWLDAGYDYVSDLLVISEEVADLDADLEINKDAASVIKTEIVGITAFLESTSEWYEKYSSMDENSTLSVEQYEEMWNWLEADLGRLASWSPLDSFPEQGTPVSGYKIWIDDTTQQADIVLDELEHQLALLDKERELILPEYHQKLDDSLGLSANIVLQENSAIPVVDRIRNPGMSAFVGAGLGLLGWLIFTVIEFRGPRNDEN